MAELNYYQVGATPLTASQVDQRFSYCLYVPESVAASEDRTDVSVLVIVHGTGRQPTSYRDLFAEFCERHRAVVVAPLFPAGIGAPWELRAYKYLKQDELRYDEVLLAMLAEVSDTYRIPTEQVLMFGFSGGGQFTHRFLYLHPERLRAASIGAPGVVTLLDATRPWPAGTGGAREIFGADVDPAAVARVPVQVVIGTEDTETWEIGVDGSAPEYIAGVNDVGVTRLTRIEALRQSLQDAGARVDRTFVDGIAHDGLKVVPSVVAFFGRILGSSAVDAAS